MSRLSTQYQSTRAFQLQSGVQRYGFNGKEVDSEGMGGGSTTYDYGFRIYNAQLGKFLSVDPLFKSFPYYSTYQFASNTPIAALDIDGLESTSNFNESEIREEIDQLKGEYNAIKSCTEQIIHILNETESYLNGLYALKIVTYVPTTRLAYLLLSVAGESSIDEEIANAEADVEMYKRDVEWRLAASDKVLASIRRNAVRIAKAREVENVLNGGPGITRKFSPEEIEYIKTHGKLPSNLHGHHNKAVHDRPDLAGDPDNISIVDGGGPHGPKIGSEHYEADKTIRENRKVKPDKGNTKSESRNGRR
ncbi:MAG: RHS repeat-associated core domain-containing protein [Pseudomonadota bacterium]